MRDRLMETGRQRISDQVRTIREHVRRTQTTVVRVAASGHRVQFEAWR